MNTPIEFQTIKGEDGQPAFVVVPYKEFLRLYTTQEMLIPHEVVSSTVDGASPIRAWRDYLGLTQTAVAERMGISQAAYAQMEAPDVRPRKSTLRRVAAALGIAMEQLDF